MKQLLVFVGMLGFLASIGLGCYGLEAGWHWCALSILLAPLVLVVGGTLLWMLWDLAGDFARATK